MDIDIPLSILNQYGLEPDVPRQRLSHGLIHQTWRVEASGQTLILQKLHPVLSAPEIADDFEATLQHLAKHKFPSPRLIRTMDGSVLATGKETPWRAQTCLLGETHETIQNLAQARSAAQLYGAFHTAMLGSAYIYKTPRPLHDTVSILSDLQRTIEARRHTELYNDVTDVAERLLALLPGRLLPADLPRHVVHGDPKISNILFEGDKAVAIIDLDTCNNGNVLYDLGDLCRSWCGKQEDDPNNAFNLEVFDAFWEGYEPSGGMLLTDEEVGLIPQAIECITLELTARFLIDYFNDNYFGWDETRYASRRAHNLARVRGQMALFDSIQMHLPEIHNILQIKNSA